MLGEFGERESVKERVYLRGSERERERKYINLEMRLRERGGERYGPSGTWSLTLDIT